MDKHIPDWGEYFIELAKQVSTRASCFRASVGCVFVRDKRILSTGYNGAPSGRKTCIERGRCYRDLHNIPSGTELDRCYASGAHAETNAIMNAARYGISIEGAVMYLYGHDSCCSQCQSAILNTAISKVVLVKRDKEKVIFIPEDDFYLHPLLDS